MFPNSAQRHAPERYGKYLLLERIGEGGMADCWKAMVQGAGGFQRLVVLKRIRTEHAAKGDFVRMFVREARVSALLHHPNIVQVFDFGEHEGTYFLVMEHVHGVCLLDLLRSLYKAKRALAPATAAHVAEQVALGLNYAHALTDAKGKPRGIVHRDVTPSNIMLPFAGGVKLVDFGIAKAMDEPDNVGTRQGDLKGKLSYIAPEQVMGEVVDHQADVFSLGVVLWEMLVGKRLFNGKTDFETLKALIESRIPMPSSIRGEVPPELDVIVVRAMSRNKEFRYPTAGAMAEDLGAYLQAVNHRPGELGVLLRQHFASSLITDGGDGFSAGDADAIPVLDAMIEDETARVGPTPRRRLNSNNSGTVVQEIVSCDSSGVTVIRNGATTNPSGRRRGRG